MTSEQSNELNSWWDVQSFVGKEQYKIDNEGNIVRIAPADRVDYTVATLTDDNKDATLKGLIEKYESVTARVTELEAEWVANEDKLKLADKVDQLKEYLHHVKALGDVNKPLQLVTEWEHTIRLLTEANYAAKLQLIEMAESLAESTEWKETAIIYKDLHEKWKQAGYVERQRNDKLWNRMEVARKTFTDRKKIHQDNEERDLLDALDLKIELAEQAEALANSESWKSTTEAFQQIIEKWKTIGRTLPKKNEELWQRIMTAKTAFFDRKNDYYTKLKTEHEANYNIKLALVERAEAMRESTEWNVTAQAFASLMEEWKKTGRTQHEKGEELWKRFTTAQEEFFAAKKKVNEESRAMMEANYEQKSALLRRAEQLKNSSRWGEVSAEMNQLLDDWKKIGPVPREHNTTIWEAFIGARRHFFNRKDESRNQRKEMAIANKTARVEQAYSIVSKMKQEIEEEEEKLLDFNNALENITPGKKAEEIKTHLEVLISDCKAKMKRLREKLAAAEDELKSVDEEERKRKEENA